MSASIRHVKLTASDIAVALRAQLLTGISHFYWGPPGIGKSGIAKSVATALGIAFIDIRLANKEPSDIAGIPMIVNVGGTHGASWTPPAEMPRDLDLVFTEDIDPIETTIRFYNPLGKNNIHYCTDPVVHVRAVGTNHAIAQVVYLDDNERVIKAGSKAVLRTPDAPDIETDLPIVRQDNLARVTVALFEADENGRPTDKMVGGRIRITITGKARGIMALEEFNSAGPEVMAAAYSLILDRYVGEYHVPDGVSIVAFGNRESDRGLTFQMLKPVANRFAHMYVEDDPLRMHPGWHKWAIENNIHPTVIAFLNSYKTDLFIFKPDSDENEFPSPRTWEMVSKVMHHRNEMTPEVVQAEIIGAVGIGSGAKFVAFLNYADRLPPAIPILKGEIKKVKTPQVRRIETDENISADEASANNALLDGGDDARPRAALQFALFHMLCQALRQKILACVKQHGAKYEQSDEFREWCQWANNFVAFLMDEDNFDSDISIVAIRAAIQQYKLPINRNTVPNMHLFTAARKNMVIQKNN